MKRGQILPMVLAGIGVVAFSVSAQDLRITPGLELQLSGPTNIYYRIETSVDLTSWTPYGSFFPLVSSPYTRVVSATNQQAFFRARAEPADWTVLNNSYPDACAEHDNVNVVFRGSVTNFSIIATHPAAYVVTNYTCAENWNNCPSVTNTDYYFPYHMWPVSAGATGGWANVYRDSFWRPQGMTFTLNGADLGGGSINIWAYALDACISVSPV